jgi:iron complex outermembrane receptor protein
MAQKSVKEMSVEEINQLSQDELLEMPLEDLMEIVKRFKLNSLEELYEKVLNPEIETPSRFAEKYFKSPVSTYIITSEDIAASGALNIPEVLRMAPGLIVREKTNGNYDVHIRGNDNIPSGQTMFYSENSLTLVMIDYRPVYNHFQGGTFWETLPVNLENIDRIEIVYGPSTALYGPNAVSGVIHIFTVKQAKDGFSTKVQAQYGVNNSQDAQANIAFAKHQFTARFTANYQHLNRFQDDYYAFDNFMDTVVKGRYIPSDSIAYFANSANEKFPDPSLASKKTAANIYLNYQQAKDANICFSAGIQQSDIQSIFIDTREFSLTARQNKSAYSNLLYHYKGFNLNASYNFGEQNLAQGYNGYQFLFGNLQANIDYLYQWKNLKIQPGLNYQYVFYDDMPFLEEGQTGIFNGKQELSNTAGYLRLDYLLFEKLRLTAAGRWEWFKLPEQNYFSYQITASYLIDRHSNIRVVYSKANRGPFMWDYHVNFTQTNQYGTDHLTTNYTKNPSLELLEMQMFEIGFRSHLSSNITTDMSFFYNKTDNYNLPKGELFQFGENHYQLDIKKENLPLISSQMGMNMLIEAVISKSVHAKIYGSIQQTNLDKVDSYYNLNDTVIVIVREDSKIHKSTPAFVGGFIVNYKGGERFIANADMYYLSSQEVFTYDGLKTVNAKAILNMKFSYKFWKQHQVFISGRNILNNTDYEFIFADRVGSEFLLGLSFHF